MVAQRSPKPQMRVRFFPFLPMPKRKFIHRAFPPLELNVVIFAEIVSGLNKSRDIGG